jgi:hypothetical protein
MLSRSRKAKGRRLQNKVREILLENFDELEPEDIKTAIMGESGEDIHMSPAARRLIPLSIECKNQESLNIWKSHEQAEINCGEHTPCVVFKRNKSKTYISLEFDKFIELLKGN